MALEPIQNVIKQLLLKGTSVISDGKRAGYLDGMENGCIYGWAFDPADPKSAVQLEIWVDGSFTDRIRANQPREDIARAMNIDPNHGFRYPVPERLFDARMHEVDVRYMDGISLNSSPLELELPNTPSCVEFEGHIDNVVDGKVLGWAMACEDRTATVSVDLIIDSQFVKTVIASIPRSDLASVYGGDGRHGFEAVIPTRFLDGEFHLIEVTVAGTGAHLLNSPIRAALNSNPLRVKAPTRADWIRSYPCGVLHKSKIGSAMSVVLPTYNRGALLETSLTRCMEAAKGLNIEFVVIDDGSCDDTAERLERLAGQCSNLRYQSVANNGPGQARNLGVTLASHELVLFIGDDVQPMNQDFFRAHLLAHEMMSTPNIAVLGKMVWPNRPNEEINFVMSHVQGMGGQQFGFYHLEPYTFLDWRFFYTCNVSIKKQIVTDWLEQGFSKAFTSAAFEDCELAYRLNKTLPGGFRILYTPASVATHHHVFNVKSFIRRQNTCGAMSRVFTDLHPEVAEEVGVTHILKAMSKPRGEDLGLVDEYLALIEGIKAWPTIIERAERLGSQNWHADLLTAVFDVAFLEGYINSCTDPQVNYEAAFRHVIERFQHHMGHAASVEMFGKCAGFGAI